MNRFDFNVYSIVNNKHEFKPYKVLQWLDIPYIPIITDDVGDSEFRKNTKGFKWCMYCFTKTILFN